MKHPDFLKLWIGQTISEFGSRITREGLPLVAVITLSATPEQMGLLTAFGTLPVLIFGLMIGVWVDRLRRRPIMIIADIGRAIILLSVPLAAITDVLTLEWIVVVMASTSILSLLFDTAYRAILPTILPDEELMGGNSKLATTESLAEIGGPAIAGLLIQVITAPFAMIFDALSFLASAISIGLMKTSEKALNPPENRQSMLREIRVGLAVIYEHPILRVIALATGVQTFFGGFFATLYSLFVVRDLGHEPATLGLLVASGGIGALFGAIVAQRLAKRYAVGHIMVTGLLIKGIANLFVIVAGGPVWWSIGCLLIGQIVGDGAMVVYMITEMTLRQTLVPNHVLGRANATIGFMAEGAIPVGALVAGGIAGIWSTRVALGIAVVGILIVAMLVTRSDVRQVR